VAAAPLQQEKNVHNANLLGNLKQWCDSSAPTINRDATQRQALTLRGLGVINSWDTAKVTTMDGLFSATRARTPTSYEFKFDGCCHGTAATEGVAAGTLGRELCEAKCSADLSCNAIEVNGCLADAACKGECFLFSGNATGTLTNGQCNADGDQKCYAKQKGAASCHGDGRKSWNVDNVDFDIDACFTIAFV
jgi:hypothetical protein